MKSKLGFLIFMASCLLMNGCSSDETGSNAQQAVKPHAAQQQAAATQTVVPQGAVDEKPHETNEQSKKRPIERGPGPLTKGNTSIAGIHIGDTPEKVKQLLGEPDEVSQVYSTPEVGWYYEKENIRVHFYRTMGGDAPLGGVEGIVVDNPSEVKTNKDVGIGDTVDQLLQAYEQVETYEDKPGPTAYWVTGSTFTEGAYHPFLMFRVDENGIIQEINLFNYLIDPEITK